MTAIAQIKEYLLSLPEGQPFPASALRRFASTDNIRQIVNRLVKTGRLKRVARGVFVKPEHIAQVGEVLPSAMEVAAMLAKSTGETIAIHGAEAARQLQLTTQVPMHLTLYTSGNTRTIKMANRTIKLKHVNPSRLIAPGTTAGLVVSALCYLGREHVTLETINRVKQRIPLKEFNKTLDLTERMPAWLADMFYRYQQEKVNAS